MRVEIRADSVVIEGYVNAVARDSRVMRDRKTGKRFVEQIIPGVFRRALQHNDVKLLLNHDPIDGGLESGGNPQKVATWVKRLRQQGVAVVGYYAFKYDQFDPTMIRALGEALK